MSTLAGIDGGGTQTRAVLVNERGERLGSGAAGPANYHSVGVDAAIANIAAALRAAIAAAGLPTDTKLDAVCMGLAGCGSDEDRAKLLAVRQGLPVVSPQRVGIESDLYIAHVGAFEGEAGIVLIAGTGSVCFGVDAKGKSARAGGWGPMFDDGGSAFHLGRHAIAHAIHVADGRAEPSALAKSVVEQLGGDLRTIAQLTAKGEDRNRIAGLAPLVFEAAARRESFAGAIIMAAVEELARCVGAVVSRLDSRDAPVEIVFTGGLSEAGRDFFQPLYDAIRRRVPQAQIVSRMLPPVMGAVMLAMRLAGIDVTPDMLSAMRKNDT